MLSDNIKKYRKEKGLSQEELAVRLHVVRQTVSKWENGLSVPDAEALMRIAVLLDVPVSVLLGSEKENGGTEDLAAELARLNELLAEKNQREKLVKEANKKRGAILLLSFVSMLLALGIENAMFSLISSGICILGAVLILYRNLALLTSVTTNDLKLKTLRVTTVFNIIILLVCLTTALLTATDMVTFSEHSEEMFATLLVACFMIFTGIVSPKLPFTRHTGLRLPWTVQDEDTWNLAHRTLGYVSLPLAFLYVACALTIDDIKTVTLAAILLWIGIPGGISFVYYWKKVHGKL